MKRLSYQDLSLELDTCNVFDDAMLPLLELHDLKRIYHLHGNLVPALRGISLNVEPGEFLSIFGPSGSGKSTLLNLIGGLDRPDAGKILFEGANICELSDAKLVHFRSEKIGFVFQLYNLLPWLNAVENVELPLAIQGHSKEASSAKALEMLRLVGLEQRVAHHPSELSGGEQQRVAIARALINEPAIVLADEPTGNLDEGNALEITRMMRKLNAERKQTFIVVTHDPVMAESSDRIIYLKDGLIEKERVVRSTF